MAGRLHHKYLSMWIEPLTQHARSGENRWYPVTRVSGLSVGTTRPRNPPWCHL